MVDGWMGDDWFRQWRLPPKQNMPYIYEQDGTRDNSVKWWTSNFDDYDMFMQAGLSGEAGSLARAGADRILAQDPGSPEL